METRLHSIAHVPKSVIRTALRAARLIGDGLYGVDLKQIGKEAVIIEINDNPNIDSGIEDAVLGEELYFEGYGYLSHLCRGPRKEGEERLT